MEEEEGWEDGWRERKGGKMADWKKGLPTVWREEMMARLMFSTQACCPLKGHMRAVLPS